MMSDAMWVGVFVFTLRNEDGSVADTWTHNNFITDVGRQHIADQLTDQDEAQMSHMAIGDGTGQDQTSTTLANETARVALTAGYPDQGTGANAHHALYYATFGAGVGTGTVSEAAVFNAATVGTMLNYVTGFTPRSKGAGQSLDLQLSVVFQGSPASP